MKNGKHETCDEERDAEDETNSRALAQRKADDEAGNEEHETDDNAERKAVGTVESTA
jgi:hypothetical protein